MTASREQQEIHGDRVCMTCAVSVADAEGGELSNADCPDNWRENQNIKSPDMTFTIGSTRYWLEYTELEFVEGQYNALANSAGGMVLSDEGVLRFLRSLVEERADKPDLVFLVNATPSQPYWLAYKLKDGDQWWGDGTLPDKN